MEELKTDFFFFQNMFQLPVPGWMLCVHMVTQEKPSGWPSLWWIRYDGNSRDNWSISADTRKVKLILLLKLYYQRPHPTSSHTEIAIIISKNNLKISPHLCLLSPLSWLRVAPQRSYFHNQYGGLGGTPPGPHWYPVQYPYRVRTNRRRGLQHLLRPLRYW